MVKDCKESYLQHTVNDTSVWTWKDAVIRKSANVLHKLGFLYENISPSLWWFKEQPLLFQLPSGVKWPFSTLFLDWLLIVRLILYLSDTPHKSQCFCCGHCQVQMCDEFHILPSSHYWMWKAADLSEKSIELQYKCTLYTRSREEELRKWICRGKFLRRWGSVWWELSLDCFSVKATLMYRCPSCLLHPFDLTVLFC